MVKRIMYIDIMYLYHEVAEDGAGGYAVRWRRPGEEEALNSNSHNNDNDDNDDNDNDNNNNNSNSSNST